MPGRHALLLLPAFIAFASASFAQGADPAPRERGLQRAVLGVWCLSEDGGRSCWGRNEYRADGTFRASGTEPDSRETYEIAGRFEVQGQLVCHTVASNSSGLWPQAGTTACSRILSVDQRRQVFTHLHDGSTHSAYRTVAR